MSAIVRAATLADLDVLAALFDAYRVFYEMPSDIAGARAFLEARIRADESALFLAFDGDEALGFTQLYPSFSSTGLGRLWILNDLFVLPTARRTGAGNALMAAAERHARITGTVGVMLSTAHSNATAQRLYTSRGYVHDENFRDYYLMFER